MGFQSAEEVLEALVDAYYDKRNIEATLACVVDDIEWIGTEHNDSAKGKQELRRLLEADIAAFPDSFGVKLGEPTIQKLGSDVVMITMTGEQIAIPGVMVGFLLRGTACCVRTKDGWLISNVHTSVPNSEVEKVFLQQELNAEREKQAALLEGVPGGVAMYRAKKDGRIATDYVSDGLAKICGYDDGKDILRDMAYDSRKLVLPEDFPVIAKACKNSLEKGIPTSVNYRIYGKDGTPVRITLDSVVMKNVELGEDDIAVFYAVQTLVSEEAKQQIEEQKLMSALLDAVPAGIGIYEIKDGDASQVYMNNAFYDLMESKRENRQNYAGIQAITAAHPDDIPRIKEGLQEMLSGTSYAQMDFRLKRDDGQWKWLHVTASAVERRENYLKLYTAFYDCTESKEQQLQLLQNQHAVELAQNQGDISIWTYNIDQKVIIQQTPSDVRGHLGYPVFIENVPECFTETDNIHPMDQDLFLKVYEQLENGESQLDAVYRIKDQKDGLYHWVHMFYQSMEPNDDGERMAVGFSMNADKQQEAIDRYQVEKKMREQMYDDAVMYIEYNLTKDQYDGKNNVPKTSLSQDWEGPSKEQYTKNIAAIADEEYVESVVEKMYGENLLTAFQRGESKVFCEYRSKESTDRPRLWYRMSATMVQSPDTDDVMAFVYVENIEKEKKRQLAMESSMMDGVESIAVIQITDGTARLIRTNLDLTPQDVGEYFKYDDDFVRRSHNLVIPEEREFSLHAALLSTVLKELETQEIYQYSVSTMMEDGSQKRQLFRFRYLDDRKADLVLSISDITSVYMEEQEKKKQLQDALLQAQSAGYAKAEFYSRMSHDMRTPMNGILGMAQLSKDERDVDVLKDNIKKIQESGEYLLSLVNDTLDIQRIESGKMILEPKIVKTIDVVNNIIDMVRVTAEAKGVNLKYHSGNVDLDWYIREDELRLKQIFINLLSNAVKFTPSGGTVELEFKLLKREGMMSHDVIYVRDNGIGMSREFLEHGIFKPFSQESSAVSTMYAGSGLGLSIAKSLVELMNGRIEVESELGVGTTFSVFIDFERVEKEEAQRELKKTQKLNKDYAANLQGKKIMLAEDHPLNAEIAKKMLEKVGCIVTWVKDGKEAVSLIQEAEVGFFDAILMDIRMPVMDGMEATRKIRALDKDDANRIPIIAMTANAYEEDVKMSSSAGMNGYLSKPVTPQVLYKTLVDNLRESHHAYPKFYHEKKK